MRDKMMLSTATIGERFLSLLGIVKVYSEKNVNAECDAIRADAKSEAKSLRKVIDNCDADMKEAKEVIVNLNNKITMLESSLSTNVKAKDSLKESIKDLNREIEELNSDLVASKEDYDLLNKKYDFTVNEADDCKGSKKELESKLKAVNVKLKEVTKNKPELKKIEALNKEIYDLKTTITNKNIKIAEILKKQKTKVVSENGHKLTCEDIKKIKKLRNSDIDSKKIASEFNVSESTVSRILTGKTYKKCK